MRAIAAVVVLFAAALAAAPVRADDTGVVVPSGAPDSSTTVPTAPQSSSQPASQTNTATNTQTATATGGAGGTATGGNAGPSQGAGGSSHGGDAYANGGSAQSHNSVENKQSSQIRPADDGLDEVVPTKPRKSRPAARRTHHTRSPARAGSGAARDVPRSAAERSRGHRTGAASPVGHGPRRGSLPPDQQRNFIFSLLSAPGGAGAGLTLLLLAVLGAAIALPRERFRAFRPSTVQWRPLAYVPPIELPG